MSSEQELILSSCCLSSMRRNSVFEVLRVKRLADIQKDIAYKGVCVNEKHSKDRERCPARPYSSSGAGTSGVVLRHRATAAACACLMTAAATYCTPEAAAQIRPADGFLHKQCPYVRVLRKFFSNMVFYSCGLHRKLLS